MSGQVPIEIVAEEAIGRFLEEAAFAEWEDFAEVGEYDWDRVLEVIKRKAKEIRPKPEVFQEAYEWLAARADKDAVRQHPTSEPPPDPRLPTDPDPHRRFLIDLDNELSGAIRRLRSVRQAVQKELGWSDNGE